MIQEILNSFPEEEILIADGFNEAIIGIDDNFRLICSVSKCIDILKKDEVEKKDHTFAHVVFSSIVEEIFMFKSD